MTTMTHWFYQICFVTGFVVWLGLGGLTVVYLYLCCVDFKDWLAFVRKNTNRMDQMHYDFKEHIRQFQSLRLDVREAQKDLMLIRGKRGRQ